MHYIGILFGGDLDLLEQYYEGLEVEEYISHTKEEIIGIYINNRKEAIKWRREKIKENDANSSEYQQWINENPRYNKRTAWKDIKEDYKGRIDKNGNILSTYNPDSEWDWYAIGGRWSGYFPIKDKDENGETLYCDEVTIGEVDWDKYFKERKSPYCYITEEGEWVSKGEIGWLNYKKAMKEPEWQKQFKKELSKYSKDTVLVAVDFHI